MTRRPADGPGQSAVYASLLERAEDESRHSMPLPGNAARLAALRAGDPVDVQAGELPAWAREGQPPRWWRRARVTADGAVRFYDDSGAAWLAENRL